MPKQQDKVGAVWIRESRGGAEFMKGTIEIDGQRVPIVIFKNGYRTEVNRQPHYIIYRDTGEQPSRREDESEPLSD